MSKASQRRLAAAQNKQRDIGYKKTGLKAANALMRLDPSVVANNPRLVWSKFLGKGEMEKSHQDDHEALFIHNAFKDFFVQWSQGSQTHDPQKNLVKFVSPGLLIRLYKSDAVDYQEFHPTIHGLTSKFEDLHGLLASFDEECADDYQSIRGWALGFAVPMPKTPFFLVCATPSGATLSAIYVDGHWITSKSPQAFGLVGSLTAHFSNALESMGELNEISSAPSRGHLEMALERRWIEPAPTDSKGSAVVPGASHESSAFLSHYCIPYVFQAHHLSMKLMDMQRRLDTQNVEVDERMRNQLLKRDSQIRLLETQVEQARADIRRLQRQGQARSQVEASHPSESPQSRAQHSSISVEDRMTAFFQA